MALAPTPAPRLAPGFATACGHHRRIAAELHVLQALMAPPVAVPRARAVAVVVGAGAVAGAAVQAIPLPRPHVAARPRPRPRCGHRCHGCAAEPCGRSAEPCGRSGHLYFHHVVLAAPLAALQEGGMDKAAGEEVTYVLPSI